jgi:hypothetical protein
MAGLSQIFNFPTGMREKQQTWERDLFFNKTNRNEWYSWGRNEDENPDFTSLIKNALQRSYRALALLRAKTALDAADKGRP